MEKKRCPWAEKDPVLRAYHDEEWGLPVHGSRELWEMLMLEGFQAGLSWITILRRREAFRKAFQGFKPDVVARFCKKDVARLATDEGIIRSRAKILATICNAQVYLEMAAAGEDFSEFLWAEAGGKPIQNRWKKASDVPAQTPLSAAISATLKKRGFKFVGPVIVYAWMQAVGRVNDHINGCFRQAQIEG